MNGRKSATTNSRNDFEKVTVVYFSRKNDEGSDRLLRKFIESYVDHPAGYPHRLFFIKKGYRGFEDEWRAALAPLAGVEYEEMEVPDRHYCFGYQRQLLERFPDHYFLFISAHGRFLVDDWLDLYMRHARPNRILGNTGNYFSLASGWTPNRFSLFDRDRWSPKAWLRFLLFGKEDRLKEHPVVQFPNPHVRTSIFMVPPGILDVVDWPGTETLRTKLDEYFFESGKFGLSVQAWKAGLELYVVGADGEKYPVERWFESKTFYSGKQENTIIGDNHTRLYDSISPYRKRRWIHEYWGENTRPDIPKIIESIPLPDRVPRCVACGQRGLKIHAFTTGDLNRHTTEELFSYSKCLHCGTISIDSIPENPSDYHVNDCHAYTTEEDRSMTDDMLDLIRRYAKKSSDYLELGPGAGRIARVAYADGYRITCIEMDEQCCRNLRQFEGIEVIHSNDIEQSLRAQTRTWDVILASHVFEHLADPLAVFRQCAAKLNPGGVLIMAVPDIWSLAFRLFREKVRFMVDAPRHLTFITEQTYLREAELCDLALCETIRNDVRSQEINRHVWSSLSEYLDDPTGKKPTPAVRVLFFAYKFWHRIILQNKKSYGSDATDSLRRTLLKLERRLGKSNAFTLVLQKERSEYE